MKKFIVTGNVRKKNVAVLAMMMVAILSACSPVEIKTAGNSMEQSLSIDAAETKSQENSAETPEYSPIIVTETPEESLETTGELSEDALEVKNITEVFCTAYFDRNIDGIKEAQTGDRYTVYCGFKPNAQSDTFQYLTIEFIKQEDGWKVLAYGLEL